MGKTIGILIIVLVVILGGWYLLTAGKQVQNQVTPQATTTAENNGTNVATSSPSGNVTVTYTDAGFSPSSVTIAQGQSVTWVDKRSNPMWVASNQHPVHSGYDGTSKNEHCTAGYTGAAPFDQCGGGTTYTFTFDKAGSWPYHDHLNASEGGTVIVTAAQ